MTDDPRNDEAFWMSAGVDFAHRRWGAVVVLSTDETKELGRIMVQAGPDEADEYAASLESMHQQLGDTPDRMS